MINFKSFKYKTAENYFFNNTIFSYKFKNLIKL